MELTVNEAKLASLWARSWGTIQLVLTSKFAFAPEKLPCLSRKGPMQGHSSPANAGSSLSEFPFRRGFSRNGVGKLAAAQGLFLILVSHSYRVVQSWVETNPGLMQKLEFSF